MGYNPIEFEEGTQGSFNNKTQNRFNSIFLKKVYQNRRAIGYGFLVLFILLALLFIRISNRPSTVKVGIQTVFVLKQNVPFMRQWFIYHINLGVDYFFLYDNSGKKMGTKLQTLRTSKISKYGFNLAELVPYNDTQIQEEWKAIYQDFKKYIVYVPWKPRDQLGNTLYNQPQSMAHYIKNYGHMTDFTIFIDIDQYLYSKKQINLKKYLMDNLDQGITRIKIHQKKFKDRWCSSANLKVTQIYECILVDTHKWAQKNILVTKYIQPGEIVHFIYTTQGRSISASEDQFRFHHYNLNAKQYEWMAYQYFFVNKFQKCEDDSLKMYDDLLEKECNQKCNDKHFRLKYPEGQQKEKLCYMPEVQLVNQ